MRKNSLLPTLLASITLSLTLASCSLIPISKNSTDGGGTNNNPANNVEFVYTKTKDGTYAVSAGGLLRNAKEITIPSTYQGVKVTTIPYRAFISLENVETIVLPESIEKISIYSFAGCTSLKTFYWNAPNIEDFDGDGFFLNCPSLTDLVFGEGVKRIPSRLFFENNSLTNISISSSVKEIGHHAFVHCDALTSVEIPGNVETVGDCAFCGCQSLNNVYFGDGVLSLGSNIFAECPNLETVRVPNSIIKTGYDVLGEEPTVHFNMIDDACYLGNEDNPYALLYGAVNSVWFNHTVSIHEDCRHIANCSLRGIMNESIIFPDNVTSIGDQALYNTGYIQTVYISKNIKFIGDKVFEDCPQLSRITVDPENTSFMTEAGTLYTADKSELICHPAKHTATTVTVTDVTKVIRDAAFYACENLEYIQLANSIEKVEGNPFIACTNLKYNIAGNGYYIGNRDNLHMVFIRCKNYEKNIDVEDDCRFIVSYAFNDNEVIESLSIPGSVKTINTRLVFYSDSLTSVTIADGVKTIEKEAFSYCRKLDNVVLPDSVLEIGEAAFQECNSLKNIKLSEGLTVIPREAFYCCGLKTLVIPNSVKIIHDAFWGCEFETIVLSESLERICVSFGAVGAIYYPGSQDQWNMVLKDNVSMTPNVYFYSESQPTAQGNYWRYVDNVPTKW